MSLIMEMCRTHQISNTQEMSDVFLLKMYMKYEISDVTGHVQEMSCVLVLELYLICEISNTTGNVIFPWLGNLNEM